MAGGVGTIRRRYRRLRCSRQRPWCRIRTPPNRWPAWTLTASLRNRVIRLAARPTAILLALLVQLCRFLAQLFDRALDRTLHELAVQRSVDDDRSRPLELDEDGGGTGLIDIVVREPDRRGTVGVPVDLLVQLLGLDVQLLGFLPSRSSAISRAPTWLM